MHSQLLQHGNGIADNDQTLVFLQIPDEFPIDLDLIQCLILQHVHGRISGTEIIHGHQEPSLPQAFHAAIHTNLVLQECALCQFQRNILRQNIIFLPETEQCLCQFLIIRMQSGYIDGNRNKCPAFLTQLSKISKHFLPDIFIYIDDKSVFLQYGNKLSRWHQPLFRMLPAHKRLTSDHSSGPHIDLGLHIQL